MTLFLLFFVVPFALSWGAPWFFIIALAGLVFGGAWLWDLIAGWFA